MEKSRRSEEEDETMNRICLMGRLTREPVREGEGKSERTEFTLAHRETFGRKLTHFFPCTAWGAAARHVAERVRKGDRLLVEGRLRQEAWTAPGGERQTRITVVVERVYFLEPKDPEPNAPPSTPGESETIA